MSAAFLPTHMGLAFTNLSRAPLFRTTWFPALLLLATVFAAYGGTWRSPYLMDDLGSVIDNLSIRRLSQPAVVFNPPSSVPTRGRPLANATFAVSYAISGLDPWAHRAINIGLHAGAALALFGVVRRTLQSARLQARFSDEAGFLATMAALTWACHPLLTQSVTYISQRTEVLMALCYLLTLYGFIRGARDGKPAWLVLSVVCCLLGALSKEVIATAPIAVLLYDRIFVAGRFREILARRWWFYLGLASSWGLLAFLMRDLGTRGVGDATGLSKSAYALTQCKAQLTYLARSLWPHPLIFDHTPTLLPSLAAAWPYVAGLAAVVAGTLYGLRRWAAAAFGVAWFLLLLLPTSSVIPIAGAPIGENRAYLPSAGIVVLAVIGVHAVAGARFSAVALTLLAVGGFTATWRRNLDYRSVDGIWADTLAKAPDNYRAQHSLANAIENIPGRREEAMERYRAALRLNPEFFQSRNNLANLLARDPAHHDEAIAEYETALRQTPTYAAAHNNLAKLLVTKPGRLAEAQAHYETALLYLPDFVVAHENLADLHASQPGRDALALQHYEFAARITPENAVLQNKLGYVLARQPGRQEEARRCFETALRLSPEFVDALVNLGRLCALQPGGKAEARAHFERALSLNPSHVIARHTFGLFLAGEPGTQAEAVAQFREALRLKPDFVEAHIHLGDVLARQPASEAEAIQCYQKALELNPESAEAHNNLGDLLARAAGREDEALAHFQKALRLSPENAIIHFNVAEQLEKRQRRSDAVRHYSSAVRLDPNFKPARAALRRLAEPAP